MPLGQGTFIGPYEVVGWLGAGGMGEAYRARDARLDRDVAIKLLPSKFVTDPTRLRRFEHEARAAGRLNHPNVLTVHDVGSLTGIPYVVSELLDGETLRERLSRGPISPARSAEYARQTANGLAAAHERGIVHRDIKPENLFVTRDDRVKILDFGIAKLLTADDRVARHSFRSTDTVPGAVPGTSGYMSPEQLRGESVDARSDIFSVGAVLHEMLSGRPAFTRDTPADTTAAILSQDPDPLEPPVPQALSDIVRRCLEKRREARFQSARDLAFALDLIPHSAPVRVVSRRSLGWQRYAISAIVVLLLGPGVSWIGRPSVDIEERFSRARFVRLTDWEGTEAQAQISPDGRLVAFIGDRDGAFDLWISQIGTGRFQNLTTGTTRFPAPVPPLRMLGFTADSSEVWLALRGGSGVVPVTGGTPSAFLGPHSTGAAWSPDGSHVAFFRDSEGDPLFLADAAGANARQIFVEQQAGIHTHNPAWSPDGSWIYFVHGRSAGSTFEMDLWRIRPTGASAEQLTDLKTALDFIAPVGDRTVLYVARAADRSGPWLWALDVGTRRSRRLVSGLDQYRSVSASRDGRRIVATVANSDTLLSMVKLLDRVADDRDVQPYPQLKTKARMPRFGRQSLFFVAARGGEDSLWRLTGGEAVEIWKGTNGPLLEPPAVSPDETRVAAIVRRDGSPQLAIMSANGTDVRTPAPSVAPEGTVDWSPDGAWLVVGGRAEGRQGLFKIAVADGSVTRLVDGPAANPIWSPAGDLIVYNGPIVGGLASLRGVKPSGEPVMMAATKTRPGGQRFTRDGRGVIYQSEQLDFNLLDLASGATRPLTKFKSSPPLMAGRTFDVSPDGTFLVFDRFKDNSDVVLIELPD